VIGFDSCPSCKYRIVRVIVIGAGAIGAPIAARLHEHGHPVVLVARGANYEVIEKCGVTIATPDTTSRSRIDVVNGISSLTFEQVMPSCSV